MITGDLLHDCKNSRRRVGAVKQGKLVSINSITYMVSKACVMYASYFLWESVGDQGFACHFRVQGSQISKGKHI